MPVLVETFTNTNGTELDTHNSNFTRQNGGASLIGIAEIQSNALAGSVDAKFFSYFWNAHTFDDDQYSQIKVVDFGPSGGYIGLSVRCSGTGSPNCYLYIVDDADAGYLYKYVSGTQTLLDGTGATVSTDDIIRLEAEGTTIRVLINGSEDISVVDSSITSGAPGVAGLDDESATLSDDWEGGNLQVIGPFPTRFRV